MILNNYGEELRKKKQANRPVRMCTRVRVCGAKAKRNVEGPVREAPGGKDTDCQCGWNRESRRNGPSGTDPREQ